jgi:NitT/TauT family transport system permease protein
MSQTVAHRACGLTVVRAASVASIWVVGLAAAATWFAAAGVTVAWPDIYDLDYTPLLMWAEVALGALLLVTAFAGQRLGRFGRGLRYAGAWIIAIGLVFAVWELVTAKFGLLPRPFFTAPQNVLAAFIDDWPRILECVYDSLRLLLVGVAVGAGLGFAAGLAIGWSPLAHYWGYPLLRFVGLFMGLSFSFAILVVAEMLGVKAGLGWYCNGHRAGPPTATCMRA